MFDAYSGTMIYRRCCVSSSHYLLKDGPSADKMQTKGNKSIKASSVFSELLESMSRQLSWPKDLWIKRSSETYSIYDALLSEESLLEALGALNSGMETVQD